MSECKPDPENMTTHNYMLDNYMDCPAEPMLKLLAGKWKPQILYLASKETLRFNSLVRLLPGSNKQSVSLALRELEEAAILEKKVIREKPLHIEYSLTERGKAILPVFRMVSSLTK